MLRIGIDLGTTTISAAVLDEGSRVVESRTVSGGSFLHTAHSWEKMQDAGEIIRKAVRILEDLLSSYGGKDHIASIGLTGQMHGIVYVNGRGECISPLYTWQDRRGDIPDGSGKTLVQRIEAELGRQEHAGYGLVTHLFNLEHGLVPEGAAKVCTIMDCLGMVLTGRDRPLVHAGNAASLGFYDARKRRFRAEDLIRMGIDPRILPETVDHVTPLGLWNGIPVMTAIGDNQASFLGAVKSAGEEDSSLLIPGTVLVNVGTGGQTSVLSDQWVQTADIEARPFDADSFLLVGSSLCGGRAYAVLERFFRGYLAAAGYQDAGPQYDVLQNLAQSGMEQNSDLKIRTTLEGTRSRPLLRGEISGLDEDNFTPEAFAYGVICGIADELHGFYEEIRSAAGLETIPCLVGSGNGLRRNPVMQEVMERKFGTALLMASWPEEAACGAALGGS